MPFDKNKVIERLSRMLENAKVFRKIKFSAGMSFKEKLEWCQTYAKEHHDKSCHRSLICELAEHGYHDEFQKWQIKTKPYKEELGSILQIALHPDPEGFKNLAIDVFTVK